MKDSDRELQIEGDKNKIPGTDSSLQARECLENRKKTSVDEAWQGNGEVTIGQWGTRVRENSKCKGLTEDELWCSGNSQEAECVWESQVNYELQEVGRG